jgi:hypothetical protein
VTIVALPERLKRATHRAWSELVGGCADQPAVQVVAASLVVARDGVLNAWDAAQGLAACVAPTLDGAACREPTCAPCNVRRRLSTLVEEVRGLEQQLTRIESGAEGRRS